MGEGDREEVRLQRGESVDFYIPYFNYVSIRN